MTAYGLVIVVVAAVSACAPDPIAAPRVPAPIEIAANPRPAPSRPGFYGVVVSRASRAVIANDTAVIRQLRVASGDVVAAGQVLAILDDPAMREKLAKLPKRSKARAALEKRLAAMKLVAPSAGVVSSVRIAEGVTAMRGAEMMRVSSTTRLQLRFALTVYDRGLIAKGTRVKATIAGRSKPIEAIVRSIGPTNEAPTRVAIVEADLVGVRDLSGLHGATADVALAN